MYSEEREWPLFVRGFLISSKRIDKDIEGYYEVNSGYEFIYIEKNTRHRSIEEAQYRVDIFGVIVDSESPEKTPNDILSDLLVSLKVGRECFFKRLYTLGGRYAIYARGAASPFLVGDAGGVRSLFYTSYLDDYFAGSHAGMLAKLATAPVNSIAKTIQDFGMENYRARNWPGRQSRYEGVYQLTPNTLLNFPELSVERFFPFETLPSRSFRDAALIASRYIKNTADAFIMHYMEGQNYPALLLMTSGIDSRLVLSSLRGHTDKFNTLTYRVSAANDGDMDVGQKIASLVGVEHYSFIAHKDPIPEITSWGEENSSCVYLGNRSVIEKSVKEFGQHEFSLRGNLGEISRGVFMARKAFLDNPVKFMSRVWYRGSEKHQYIIDVFDDYARTVEIEKARWPLRILYYWEHRHATWHAATANLMDCAFDTFNVLNSRSIIEAMCGVSEEDQSEGAVHREVIYILWPELMSLPINPHGKR